MVRQAELLIDVGPQDHRRYFRLPTTELPRAFPRAAFPSPLAVEPMPSGYRVNDTNGKVLAHVHGQPDGVFPLGQPPYAAAPHCSNADAVYGPIVILTKV